MLLTPLEIIKFNFFLFFLIINISLITSNQNIVVFPLIKKQNSYLANINNITDIMERIFIDLPITELNISSQKVSIIISPEEYNIYLTSKQHMSEYEDEKKIIEGIYQKINYFDDKKSENIKYDETISRSFFYNNFKIWQTVIDNLNDDIKLNFVLAKHIQFDEPGRVGLQIQEKIYTGFFTPSFLVQLKKAGKINNYTWFIYYGEKNKNDYLVLGCSPHEFTLPDTGQKIFQDMNLEEDFHNINDQLYIDKRKMEIIFDEIYLTSNISSLEKDKDELFNETYYKFGFLNTNIGCVIGTYTYRLYLEQNFFKEYLDNKKCHNMTFKQRMDSVSQSFYYFYCDDSLYQELKNSFRPLVFKKVDLSENFVLNFHDLFRKINGFLTFLIIFKNDLYSNSKWVLGTPFLRKYQFVYDFGNKQIGYYHDKFRKEIYDDDIYDDGGNNQNGEKNYKFWIYFGYISLIVFLAAMLVILGFLLGKKVYNIRKKRANELDDDNYDYKENKILND